jgi:hypothetical protein
MGVQPDRSELAQRAMENARRVAGRLREHQQDLARKMPGESQGGEALHNAAEAAERVARLLEASGSDATASHLDP